MLATNKTQHGWTVITLDGILCHRATEQQARDAIMREFPGSDDSTISIILETIPDPAEFRSVWASAVATELDDLALEMETVASQDDLDAVKTSLKSAIQNQKSLLLELNDIKRREDIEREFERRLHLQAEIDRCSVEQTRKEFGPMIRKMLEEKYNYVS